jgi:hypothetical protein
VIGPPGGDGCRRFEEVAAEFALGVVGGAERAAAVAHLESCGRCQALVDDMAAVGDSLLLLAPEAQPPAGFESRVLGARSPRAPTRPRRRRWWAAVAASASLGAAAAAAGFLATRPSPAFRVTHPAAIAAMGGRSFRAASLTHGAERMGQVFAYGGQPSWLMMVVDAGGSPTSVRCQVVTTDGRRMDVGSFDVSSYSSWGVALPVDPSHIAAVRLVAADGSTVATARL